jgi:hypothetical protein
MDDEEKLLVAQSPDPVIAARIIRNIANVERDWRIQQLSKCTADCFCSSASLAGSET